MPENKGQSVILTNTTKTPLGLPNGTIIQPLSSARVNNFQNMDSNEVVRAWLDVGALKQGDVAEELLKEEAEREEAVRAEFAKANPVGPNSDNNRFAPTDSLATNAVPVTGTTDAELKAKPWAGNTQPKDAETPKRAAETKVEDEGADKTAVKSKK